MLDIWPLDLGTFLPQPVFHLRLFVLPKLRPGVLIPTEPLRQPRPDDPTLSIHLAWDERVLPSAEVHLPPNQLGNHTLKARRDRFEVARCRPDHAIRRGGWRLGEEPDEGPEAKE